MFDRRLLLIALAIISSATALLKSPPKIIKEPPVGEQLFQVAGPEENDKPFVIECEAEGEPTPTYKWIKNGKEFEYTSYDNRIFQLSGRGTLVFSKPRDEDMGQYQCFATNEWGTATSNSVFVRKSELDSFETNGEQTIITAQEGQPFKLTCTPPDGYPKPMVYWILQGDIGQLKAINNSRMTTDPEGNLLFSNVTRLDSSSYTNYAYVCTVKSMFRNEYKLGNKVFLDVTEMGISAALNKHAPVRQYVSRRKETAQKGKKTELYCVYGGTPVPEVIWKKNGTIIAPSKEITVENFGKTLVIKHTEYKDQGIYSCDVSNGVGRAKTYNIELDVKASPFFIEEPQIENKAEGETVEIRCRAGGTPTPQISWIYNGKPIKEAKNNPRRTVTPELIEIRDLVKTDTGNYGCNATNDIGYIYKDVYVNVH